MILNQGQFCPASDIWKCLETFLASTQGCCTGQLLPASNCLVQNINSAEAEKPRPKPEGQGGSSEGFFLL